MLHMYCCGVSQLDRRKGLKIFSRDAQEIIKSMTLEVCTVRGKGVVEHYGRAFISIALDIPHI